MRWGPVVWILLSVTLLCPQAGQGRSNRFEGLTVETVAKPAKLPPKKRKVSSTEKLPQRESRGALLEQGDFLGAEGDRPRTPSVDQYRDKASVSLEDLEKPREAHALEGGHGRGRTPAELPQKPSQEHSCSLSFMRQLKKMVVERLPERYKHHAATINDEYMIRHVASSVLTYLGKQACKAATLPPESFELAWRSWQADKAVGEHIAKPMVEVLHPKEKKGLSEEGVSAPRSCSLSLMSKLREQSVAFSAQKLAKIQQMLGRQMTEPEERKKLILKTATALSRVLVRNACGASAVPILGASVFNQAWDRLHLDDLLENYVLDPAYAVFSQVGAYGQKNLKRAP